MTDETGSDTTTATEIPEETSFDFDAMATDIGKELGLGLTESPASDEGQNVTSGADADAAALAQSHTPTPPLVSTVPKTWPKEMAPHWEKTPKEVQDYWQTREKQMLDGLTQYKDAATFTKTIQDIGQEFKQDLEFNKADIPTALRFLLHANRQLTTGPMDSRRAAYQDLGKRLGVADGDAANGGAQTDPTIQRLQDEIYQIKSGLTAQQQAQQTAAQQHVRQEVEQFASDPSHFYFDEVSEDIVRLIQTGLPLQEAYEKAIWANPGTRAKEIVRVQTEHETKFKENARLQALPKKKAASVNVRGQESRQAPTDPLGSMEETIKDALAAQRTRVS